MRAHRDNIRRYQRVLATGLTETERQFMTRRLAEERSAMRALAQAPGGENVASRLLQSDEIGRLRRLKETVLGGKAIPQASIITTDDWIVDVDARLAERERAIVPPFRAN